MQNPLKGAIEFKAQGNTYTLRYSIDALCHIEARTGKSFTVIALELADPAKATLTAVREILHAGLLESHPEIDLKAAGELIPHIEGGMIGAMAKIDDAVAAAFPKPEASGTPRPPRKASQRPGTG